ncbi:integrase [Delftia sp. UME58]|nr:integrase [Delftia sp. UME58]
MKTVCRAMGLACSHVRDLLGRGEGWADGRSHRTPSDDAGLLAELRQQIADLPSYGYRRACALVNRQRAARGTPRVNAKRVYRVMAQAALLLPKAPRRRQSARTHEGRVAVSRSDLRWCSDGLEIKCDSGQTVTAAFAKDCCDREVLAWRAWEGKGLPGELVREMLVEAVERRFGSVEAVPQGQELEFLSDNGGAYIAAETRALARALGLKPINTPVCSPQSNGMAESFVNTFKRDYVARMDLSDAQTVLAQLPAAFEHFNEVHPHSSLKMRSPREFRRQQAAEADQVLYCE